MLGSVKLAGRWAAGLVTAVVVAGAAAGCTSAPAPSATSRVAAASSAAPGSATAPASPASPAVPPPGSSPAGSSPPGSSPAGTPTAVATPPGTAPPAASPGTLATPACPTRDLAARAGLAQGAAGSVYQVIDFTNISQTPCTLYGYPGVALAGGSPVTQVGAAATRSTATGASLVTLAPGATANALLRITQAQNYPAATCSPTATTYLQIYPPDQFTPIYLAYQSTGCAKTAVNLLSIGVMAAGTGG